VTQNSGDRLRILYFKNSESVPRILPALCRGTYCLIRYVARAARGNHLSPDLDQHKQVKPLGDLISQHRESALLFFRVRQRERIFKMPMNQIRRWEFRTLLSVIAQRNDKIKISAREVPDGPWAVQCEIHSDFIHCFDCVRMYGRGI